MAKMFYLLFFGVIQFSFSLGFTSNSATFISNLLSRDFKNCDVVFVRKGMNNLKVSSVIAHSTLLPNYNLNTASNITLSDQNLFKCLTSANALHNKISDRCKIIVIFVYESKTMQEYFKDISNLIAPVPISITRKESDRYIFHTTAKIMPAILSSQELPSKLKYKLVVADKGESVIAKSICFACNKGQPQIVSYSTSDQEMTNYFPDYLLNMFGKTLRISVPAIPTWMETQKPWKEKGINPAKRGILKQLFEQYYMVKFNFTYNAFMSTGKDGKLGGGGTGTKLQNGTWIGVTGDLLNGRADAGVLTASTAQRFEVIAFTNSFFEPARLTFVSTHGARIFSPQALLWPFDFFMWVSIGFSTMVAFMVFGFITNSMDYLHLDTDNNMSYARRGVVIHEKWGLEFQIFFVTTTYLDQDCVLPRFTPLRCFVALWLFFVLVITTIYRSKMVSLMAYPRLDKVPTTFEELSLSEYTVGFMKHGDAALNALKGSKDPVYVKLVKEMEIITGHGVECMERILSRPRYSCMTYDVSMKYVAAWNLSEYESRQLVWAPDATYVIYLGIALEGGSIYKEGFDRWLGWARALHLHDVWEKVEWYNIGKNTKEWFRQSKQTHKLEPIFESDVSNLTLKHVSGSFYAVGMGCFISLWIFVSELIFFYSKKIKIRFGKKNKENVQLKK